MTLCIASRDVHRLLVTAWTWLGTHQANRSDCTSAHLCLNEATSASRFCDISRMWLATLTNGHLAALKDQDSVIRRCYVFVMDLRPTSLARFLVIFATTMIVLLAMMPYPGRAAYKLIDCCGVSATNASAKPKQAMTLEMFLNCSRGPGWVTSSERGGGRILSNGTLRRLNTSNRTLFAVCVLAMERKRKVFIQVHVVTYNILELITRTWGLSLVAIVYLVRWGLYL